MTLRDTSSKSNVPLGVVDKKSEPLQESVLSSGELNRELSSSFEGGLLGELSSEIWHICSETLPPEPLVSCSGDRGVISGILTALGVSRNCPISAKVEILYTDVLSWPRAAGAGRVACGELEDWVGLGSDAVK